MNLQIRVQYTEGIPFCVVELTFFGDTIIIIYRQQL